MSAKASALLNLNDSWPDLGKLHLHGFVFDELQKDAELNAEAQKKWIGRQREGQFTTQPYEQMAEVLRKNYFGASMNLPPGVSTPTK